MNSPGETFQIGLGNGSTGCLVYRRGNNPRSRLSGILVKNICIAAEECIEIYRRILNFLDNCNFAGRDMYYFTELLSGELRYSVMFFG